MKRKVWQKRDWYIYYMWKQVNLDYVQHDGITKKKKDKQSITFGVKAYL